MITDYDSLKTQVADHLNRTDLTGVIPTLIQTAEDDFLGDPRVTKLTNRGTVTISTDSVSMPSDMYSLESWYHDGPTVYGPIEIVSPDTIATLKVSAGTSGIPGYAALVDGTARFAPEPDGTYDTKMTYWRTITRLSDTNTSNWLLDDWSSVYLYGALVAAEPYLKNDSRIATWRSELERRLEGIHLTNWNNQFGGTIRRQTRTIG